MFCKSCGKQIDSDSKFCSFCGTEHLISNNDPKLKNSKLEFEKNSLIEKSNTNVQVTEISKTEPKYDSSYKKDSGAVIIGILLILGVFVIKSLKSELEYNESYEYYYDKSKTHSYVLIFLFLFVRIMVPIWVGKISKKQNRDSIPPIILSIFFPAITLIVIGLKNKKYASIYIYKNLSNEKNSSLISQQAKDFLNNKMYEEALRFSEKSLELNPNNKTALDIIDKIKLNNNKIDKENIKIEDLEFITNDDILIKGKILNEECIGTEVFVNDNKPKDGWFISKDEKEKIYVELGKIKKRLFITKEGKYIIEQSNKYRVSIGDSIFSAAGIILENGKHKNGFMASKYIVKEGTIIGFE
jgi:hypothetical protein